MILLNKKTYFTKGISFGSSGRLAKIKNKAIYLNDVSDSILLLWN